MDRICLPVHIIPFLLIPLLFFRQACKTMKVPLISSVVSMFYFKLLKGDQSIYSIYKHNTEQSFPLLKLFFG